MKKIIVSVVCICLVIVLITQCRKSPKNTNEISIISREEGSGTRGAFVELFDITEKINGENIDSIHAKAEITNSTSVMLTSIMGNENAIGYTSLGVLNDGVKALEIDGVEPSIENAKNNKYKITRTFNIVTKNKVSKVAKDFINYIMSKEGQQIVLKEKYISVNSKKYNSTKEKGKITIEGSSSVAPLMESLKEAYMKINQNAIIELQQNDSTTGINSTINGICDIGMSSRELNKEEKSKNIISQSIAKDGIVVIVNKKNKINELTSRQVKKIFMRQITSWKDL